MIVLHGGIEGGQFFLWGEAPAEAPARNGRATPAPTPAPPGRPGANPFDAGAIRLAGALMEALPGQPLPGGGGAPPLLWAPTVADAPIPSSGLIADVAAVGPVVLRPWGVTALALPTSMTIDLLCACIGKEMLAPGILVGPTLAFWVRALRFAGALAAREQVVPGLRKNGAWRACWQPVVTGPDVGRLARLVRGMPHACRALSRSAEAPPERPAGDLVNAFLAQVADVLVRQAVAGRIDPSVKGGRVYTPTFSSLHDQWMHALMNGDGVLHAPDPELAALAEQVRAWQRPISLSTETAFQLCFRLEEPPAEAPPETPWNVRYLLQARDDPSLLIPVSEAWKTRSRAAAQFSARNFEPREYLLTALGQAAALSRDIEFSLKSKEPAGFRLDATAAHAFLTHTAWLLEQAGFAVLLPAWWSRKGARGKLTVQAEVTSPTLEGMGSGTGTGMSLAQIVQFDWKVALADEVLTLEELRRLARLKAPLVKVRGQWVQIDADEIQSLLSLVEKGASGQASLRDVVHMALGSGQAPNGLPFGGVRATGWVKEFLSQLEGKEPFADLPAPDDFHGELRPYQMRGYSWLTFLRRWGLGACLADDMGLGKTIQTLALLQTEWRANHRPSLLVCPTSVVANWKKEAERFTPDLPVLIHHGANRAKGSAFVKQAGKHALVVSSYSLLFRDRELLEKVRWAGVILDEAQNIKNPQTKQAQAARALVGDFRIALTGTPVENHVGDLWSILEFLNPGWLGQPGEFRKNFFVPIQAQQDADAAARLKKLTGPFILRRLKTDRTVIADLPEKLEMKVYCNLTREQASLYAAAVEELNRDLESAEGIRRKGVILAALTRLKQVCNHPAHFLKDNSELAERSGKVSRLTEMLEELLGAGERALVFTQFAEMGELLKKHLQETFGREVLFLHGGVPREQRARMVERFQAEGDGPKIFLLSLKAGGTGLNLTAAAHVFHFDRWWNPAVEDQATDRAFRIGQTHNVQVHKFVCVGTVEEKIDDMIDRKQKVARQVVGAGDAWLTEMSNDQLRDLFALRQDAIGE
jgi:superfamily II DNA or RNA helicase